MKKDTGKSGALVALLTWSAVAVAAPAVRNPPSAYHFAAARLEPGYTGHDITAVLAHLKPLKEKGEFETTEQYDERLAQWEQRQYLGELTPQSLLAFPLNDGTSASKQLHVAYQADAGRFDIEILPIGVGSHAWILLKERHARLGSYLGTTAMGATGRFNRYRYDYVGLDLSRPPAELHVPATPDEARKLKSRLRVFALVVPESPYVRTVESKKAATIDSPIEVLNRYQGLVASPKGFVIVDSATGQVLARDDGPFGTCISLVCKTRDGKIVLVQRDEDSF